MRRKDDNKRVLRGPPNRNRNKNQNNKRSLKSRFGNQPVPVRQYKQKKKTNKKLVIILALALLAFVVGAGIGITMNFDNSSQDSQEVQYENVTKEMTTNLNETEPIYYDSELDSVDYNDQQDLAEKNITNESATLGY